ncbi:hypothetical protein BCR37DRAFT_382691 [Protomyces lactucae-debilis]|uniref:DNA mismatch repair protein S5 domain-containing protein n=1 Tax=Protomyces lactucae-debilis TaxID=2754530 RepID=A0A1Y2F1M9_PROLT|nr:uncharacterized protein BCR37DRAFT_382691 [Protomyces lactucae-debilis]ORY77791.1 hypothetical protein BCR37DRAFT_382691 [Protomyces lactucae-debilis]
MPITKLPDTDIKLLSAAQVCTDPAAALKELLENSLDAHATSISILIDGHGLDLLTVRDNGHGIPSADRNKLACRHYTSKLTSLEDLSHVATYGFRGEALASLADIAATFVVTTRTAQDAVATSYERNSRGTCKPTKTSGEPVGTTVTATKLFKNVPVRREKLKRDGNKSVAAIKELVLSYALVHPNVRFHVSIKSGKRGETPIVVVHAPATSLEAALSRSFGATTMSACLIKHARLPLMDVTLVMPRRDAPAAAVANKGHFIYIDHRPLTTIRGLPKQLLSLLNTYATKATSASKPLILLSLTNLTGEYDVNVEPSKNMVYAANADAILTALTELLDSVYADTNDDQASTCQPSSTDLQPSSSMPPPRSQRRSSWLTSMDDVPSDSDDQEELQTQEADGEEQGANQQEDYVPDRPALTSPWTIAALSAKSTSSNPQAQRTQSSQTPATRSISPTAPHLQPPAKRQRTTEPRTTIERPTNTKQKKQTNDLYTYWRPQPTQSLIHDDADLADRRGQVSASSPVRASRTVYPPASPIISPAAEANSKSNPFSGASPTRASLVRASRGSEDRMRKRVMLERSEPEDQCHDRELVLSTTGMLVTRTTVKDNGLNDGLFLGIAAMGDAVDNMTDLSPLAKLDGGLCLLVASSHVSTLGLFVTPLSEVSSTIPKLQETRFTELKRMGDADRVVRVW